MPLTKEQLVSKACQYAKNLQVQEIEGKYNFFEIISK